MVILSAFADEISADPVEQTDLLEKLGVRHIEFRSIEKTNVMDLTPVQHERFRALCHARGFALSAIGSPIGKISVTDPFEPHLQKFRKAIELAEFHGTPRIRIFSYYLPEGADPAVHREEVIVRMRAKAALAEECGITLVLENERGIYGDTAARVLDILETVNSPALGHAFDPANYLEVGQDVGEAWSMLRDRTIHFHVKDYDMTLKRNVPAGQGQGRIPELIADAVSRGYASFCVLEPHLIVAEKMHGFTGPVRFAEAVQALTSELSARGVSYR